MAGSWSWNDKQFKRLVAEVASHGVFHGATCCIEVGPEHIIGRELSDRKVSRAAYYRLAFQAYDTLGKNMKHFYSISSFGA
jgi:hypothetical protein